MAVAAVFQVPAEMRRDHENVQRDPRITIHMADLLSEGGPHRGSGQTGSYFNEMTWEKGDGGPSKETKAKSRKPRPPPEARGPMIEATRPPSNSWTVHPRHPRPDLGNLLHAPNPNPGLNPDRCPTPALIGTARFTR